MEKDKKQRKKDAPEEREKGEGELERFRRERDEYLDGWKRAQADLLNYKRGEEDRFKEFTRFYQESFVKDLLQVLESFDRGIASLKDDDEAKGGLERIRDQLLTILVKQGLEEIHAEPGSDFNPGLHEAIGEVEAGHPPGSVAEELRTGYLLSGKVIIPAQVRLSKGQHKESQNKK